MKTISILITLFTSCCKLVSLEKETTKECRPVVNDPCTCRTATGLEYSLWAINNATSPRFKNVPGAEDHSHYVFDYSPCTPFTNKACRDVLICQKHKGDAFLRYTIATPTTFKTEFVEGSLEFHYHGSATRHARIILNCNPNATIPEISNIDETMPDTGSIYTTILTSMHACPKQTNTTFIPSTAPATTARPTTIKATTIKATTSSKKVTTLPKTFQPPKPTSCPPCPFYSQRGIINGLVTSIIILLLIQLASYTVIGFVWYKRYTKGGSQYGHKSFKNLDQVEKISFKGHQTIQEPSLT